MSSSQGNTAAWAAYKKQTIKFFKDKQWHSRGILTNTVPSIWPTVARHKSVIAQWLDHLTGVRKVIGFIPVRDSDFFLCPMLVAYDEHYIFLMQNITFRVKHLSTTFLVTN